MLIASCLLACIGLDLNSAAVIIGAMLISPLMGPILGLGFSMANHDRELLTRAAVNLLVTVAVTVLTSFIYFMLTPLVQITDEISARTRPALLDVFIAVAGGTAGIIACSRKKVASAIPGVGHRDRGDATALRHRFRSGFE